jgi:GT2 family glycosyltransferase
MPTPLPISLLIPCHNAARHLPALAASIRALDPAFADILCHDDGSTDDTLAVARSLGLPIVAGGANLGVSHARNRLAAAATGEWLHFQDADDPLLPGFLAEMRPLLRPDVDVAVCDTDWVDSVSRSTILSWRYPAAPLRADPLAANLRQGIGCNTMIIRRTIFNAVGGFDETLRRWEDADLHVRLAAAGARYDSLEKVAAVSLRYPDSLSHDYRASWNARLSALQRYASILPERVRPVIAEEAERAADTLLSYQDAPAAASALALARRLGRAVPSTRNPALRLARAVLPPLMVLRLQQAVRRRA